MQEKFLNLRYPFSSKYRISPGGVIISPTGRILKKLTKRYYTGGRTVEAESYCVACANSESYANVFIKDLVANAWCIKPKKEWFYSPYADNIASYRRLYLEIQNNNSVPIDLIGTTDNNRIYYVSRFGEVWISPYCRLLSPDRSRQGYYRVTIGANHRFCVHRLVAYYFCPKPKHLLDVPYEQLDVNHKDCNTGNNR